MNFAAGCLVSSDNQQWDIIDETDMLAPIQI